MNWNRVLFTSVSEMSQDSSKLVESVTFLSYFLDFLTVSKSRGNFQI